MMKWNQLLGAAVAALLVSQGAFAYRPDVDTPDLEIRLSGASATADAVVQLVVNNLCVGNTDQFSGTNQKAVFCDMDANSAGISGNLKVLVRKSSQGGSGNGVLPVCDAPNGGQVPFAVFTTSGTNACTQTSPGVWSCGTFSTVNLTPDGGTSDVKPTELFGGTSPNCGADVYPSYETVFGIAVSRSLRNALQIAEGITNVDSDAAADMPSLSTELVSAIMAGRIKKWSDVYINGQPLTSVTTAGNATSGYGTISGATRVTICRRVDTSGTFSSQNIRLLQRTCVAGALAPAGQNSPPLDNNGPVVAALNSGSDDEAKCLTGFDSGGGAAGNGNGVYNTRNGSKWAIGHQSTDQIWVQLKQGANPVPAVQADWRFVRLNGALPTFENVANGSYKYSVSSTIQWNAAYLNSQSTVGNPNVGSDKIAILTNLKDNAATAAGVGGARVQQPWGWGGVMALGDNGNAVSYVDGTVNGTPCTLCVYNDALPVQPLSHNPSGTNFSNCVDPSMPSTQTVRNVPIETHN